MEDYRMEKKKYFISADIEGCTDVTAWHECEVGGTGYGDACRQMSLEVAAACEAILEAGHEVVVRDGHGSAKNINHSMLPRGTKLMRGWACHPGSMMAGLDNSYAGVLYIGYHAPAGSNGSPLAHTINHTKVNWIKVNGQLASEFTLNSLYAAQQGVAPIFISGDADICRRAAEEYPGIGTMPTKECRGNSTFNMHPADACDAIKAAVAEVMKKEAETPTPVRELPEELVLEVNLCTHQQVRSALIHPAVEQVDESTVRYVAKKPAEMNAVREYIMG